MSQAEAKDPSYISIGGKKFHRAWLILVGCCFLQAGALGNILTSAGVFMVPVCTELGFARSQLSLYISMYFAFGIVGLPVAGKLLTRFDTRLVMTICTIALAASVALMGTYTQLWQWIASGIVFGTFGSAVFMVPYSSMIANWFLKRSGFAMGAASCCAAIAAAVFAPFYQFIITEFGWRIAYFVQGGIVAAFILPWTLTVFRIHPDMIGAKPYGYGEEPDASTPYQEPDETEIPRVPMKRILFSIPFAMMFLYAGITALVGGGFDSHMPGYAISLGYTAAFGALTTSALQLGSFCEKIIMGVLNDKIGVRKTVFLEFALISLGAFGLIVSKDIPWLFLASAALFGVQDSLLAVSFPLLLRQVFDPRDFTDVYAFARGGSGVIGIFAAPLVGLSFDLTGSFVPAFVCAIALCAFGVVEVIIAYKFRQVGRHDNEKAAVEEA